MQADVAKLRRQNAEHLAARDKAASDQARLAAIVECSDDAIISKGLDGVIQTWNKAAECLFGYRSHEVVGKPITILIPEDRIAEEALILGRLRRGERIEHYQTIRVRKDGCSVPVSISVSPIRDERGKIVGASKIARDISERQRSQTALIEGEQRIRAIVDAAVDAIITIDDKGIIESANPATEQLFGYARSEMIGRNVNMLMPEPYHSGHNDYLRRYLHTGQARIIGIGRDVTAQRKDGTAFPIHLSISEVQLESRKLFTGIIRDLTSQRKLEQRIVEAGVEEQRRIGQDLHDGLCQDLIGIAFQADFVARQLQGKSLPEADGVNRVAASIREAATQARRLSHGLNPVDVRGGGLLVALDGLARRISDASQVACNFQADTAVQLDDDAKATHVYRIAQEAINNAIKHGKPKRIDVRLETRDGRLVLTVADNGVGLPSNGGGNETRSRRLSASPAAVPSGSGIGLQTMQYRAQMIGGVFDIRPRRGRGTLVTCSIPEEPAKGPNNSGPGNGAGRHGHTARSQSRGKTPIRVFPGHHRM